MVVQNSSAVPIRLASVDDRGFETMRGEELTWQPLPHDEQRLDTISLTPTEDHMYYALSGRQSWSGFVLGPGDEMAAHVMNNHDLRIRYRRAGWTGVFERREVQVRGGT